MDGVAEASPDLFMLLDKVENVADELVPALEALGFAYLHLILSQPVVVTVP